MHHCHHVDKVVGQGGLRQQSFAHYVEPDKVVAVDGQLGDCVRGELIRIHVGSRENREPGGCDPPGSLPDQQRKERDDGLPHSGHT